MNSTKERNGANPPLLFSTASSAHQEHPERNEDYLVVDRHHGLAVICDGVGSAFAADQAARLAANTIKTQWRSLFAQFTVPSQDGDRPDLKGTIQQLLESANEAVCTLSEQLTKQSQGESEETHRYAVTTIATALFYRFHSGYLLTYAHVGDSRIYLLRENADLQRLTIDDGYFLLLVNKGTLSEEDVVRIDQASSSDQLTETEQEYFEKRNGITQALGEPDISIHTGQIELRSGDRILLCTDGIHDNLTDAEISETLRKGTNARAARRLVQRARARSQQDKILSIRPKKDDMSAIVVTCLFPPELS